MMLPRAQTPTDRWIVNEGARIVGAPTLETASGILVMCRDGWHAARLLAALCELDVQVREELQRLGRSLRRSTPARTLETIRAYVRAHVRFAPEKGEIFVGPLALLEQGAGDCDDHARLVYGLARTAGLSARLAFLGPPGEDPAHVVAQAHDDVAQRWRWIETTFPAELGEHPLDAVERLGAKARPDLVGGETAILHPMTLAGLTDRITDDDLTNLGDVAKSVGADPHDLLTVLWSESGMRPDAGKGRGPGGAHGLNQVIPNVFGSAGLSKLGWTGTLAEYDEASITDQLVSVVRAFLAQKGGTFPNATALYLYNFLPAYVGRANQPDFVLLAKDGSANGHPGSWYNDNKSFDRDGKGYITVADVTRQVNAIRSNGEYRDAAARLTALVGGGGGGGTGPETPPSSSGGPGVGTCLLVALGIAGAFAAADHFLG